MILDDVAGAKLATEHLISLGHTRIGLVGGIPSSDIARRREHGYALALHDAGLRRRESLVRRIGYSPEQAAVAIESLARTDRPPNGRRRGQRQRGHRGAHRAAPSWHGCP